MFLECVGALALIGGSVYSIYKLPLLILGYAFKDFAGGHCSDTEQHYLTSPDGKHQIWSFHRTCGGGADTYPFDFVYLSTGNPNKGYEWTPIVELRGTRPGETSVHWDTSEQVTVTHAKDAKPEDVSAKVLGIRIVLDPDLPIETKHP